MCSWCEWVVGGGGAVEDDRRRTRDNVETNARHQEPDITCDKREVEKGVPLASVPTAHCQCPQGGALPLQSNTYHPEGPNLQLEHRDLAPNRNPR